MGGKKGEYQTPRQKTLSEVGHVIDHTVKDKALHLGVHNISNIARNVGKTVARMAPKAIPAMVKAAPTIARVGMPLVTKIAAPLLSAPVSALAELALEKGYGADFLSTGEAQKTGGGTMAGLDERARMYRPKHNMTKTIATVKRPAYSGQSAMGKAVMASVKKKV